MDSQAHPDPRVDIRPAMPPSPLASRASLPAPQPAPGPLPAWYALVLVLLAVALRGSTFGSPNLHVDEAFYQSVGVAMHHGAVPYVDVWDRKPWGLFFLYYLIAFLSYAPLAYQLVATGFVAATAWVIARFAQRWSSPRAGLFAGIVYLLWLDRLQGFGGQTPVFYNLFIVLAAWATYSAREALLAGRTGWRPIAAMLLAGCAITVKTTAIFEGAFFGLACASWLIPSPASSARKACTIAGWAALGALPFLAISAWYALNGYWDIYWQAMVLSNLEKHPIAFASEMRALIVFIILAPVLIVAVLGLPDWKGPSRRFVLAWLLAALVGLCAVPNFYMHYALPILVPLAIATARFFQRPRGGPVALACLTLWSLQSTHAFDFARTAKEKASITALVEAIESHDDGRDLFIVDGPSQLYTMTGHRYPTPLVFPHHLGHLIEKDLSHLSTLGEVRRVLATRPGIIVVPAYARQDPPNMHVYDTVFTYVHAHCRKVASVMTYDLLTQDRIDVWAMCSQRPPAR